MCRAILFLLSLKSPFPFSIDILFLYGEVTAAAVSTAGIVWEFGRGTRNFAKIARLCVVGGVLAEVFFTLCLFVSEEITTQGQRATIEAQQSQIIALERAAGPRNLTGDEIRHIVSILKPLGGQSYDLTLAPMLESGSFLQNQIVALLRDSGWTLSSIEGNVEKAQLPFDLLFFAKDDEYLKNLKILQSDFTDSSRLTDIKIGLTHDVVGVQIIFDSRKMSLEASKAVFTLSKELNSPLTKSGLADSL